MGEYTSWETNEPNNGGSRKYGVADSQRCVQLSVGVDKAPGTWKDKKCENQSVAPLCSRDKNKKGEKEAKYKTEQLLCVP